MSDGSIGSFVRSLPQGEWVEAYGHRWRLEAEYDLENDAIGKQIARAAEPDIDEPTDCD